MTCSSSSRLSVDRRSGLVICDVETSFATSQSRPNKRNHRRQLLFARCVEQANMLRATGFFDRLAFNAISLPTRKLDNEALQDPIVTPTDMGELDPDT